MHRQRIFTAITALTFLSVGCGSKSQAALEPSPSGKTDPGTTETPGDRPAPSSLTRELVEGSCKNLVAINGRDDCGVRIGYDDCVASLSETDGAEPWEVELRAETLTCLRATDKCTGMSACFALERDKKLARHGPRKCGEDLAAPITLDAEAAAKRRGAAAEKYSEIETSQAEPIEVCGTSGQVSWLLAAVCDDGTAPFSTRAEAHQARSGNTGRGGRCNSTIDLYKVTCPEKVYDIFIDMYMCGPKDTF